MTFGPTKIVFTNGCLSVTNTQAVSIIYKPKHRALY